ncbi:MAG: aroB [Bacteroidetes bacterium]|jgi:3-dehydroquinate synthase|nr:aroB [Bacteroidota bacterium]
MTGASSYNIKISAKITTDLSSLIKASKYSSFFIICDSNTLKYCLSELVMSCKPLKEAEVIELEPGEDSKELNVIANIWQTLTEFGADKSTLIVNLGGGVVSDAGGFAASTYKRGVDFVNVPTSLLAMADASVGGKNGINFSGLKNHIGTILQPKAVFINTGFLNTLPHRHVTNGFAEILKMALICDKKFFSKLSSVVITADFNDKSIIEQSVKLKAAVVKKDPAEKKFRKILNFGHTVGHALESLYLTKTNPLLHGEAIAVGMAIETYLSFLLKRITKKEMVQIINTITLNFDLPIIDENDLPVFYLYLKQDKKHRGGALMFALLKGMGKCDPEVPVTITQLEKAISYYNSDISNAAPIQ